MTAGGKFNLCIKEFSESNNLKLRGETSSPDAAGSPVLDDKISYIQLTTMALWSTLAFCSSIQSKMIHFSKNMKRWTFNLYFFFFQMRSRALFLNRTNSKGPKSGYNTHRNLGRPFCCCTDCIHTSRHEEESLSHSWKVSWGAEKCIHLCPNCPCVKAAFTYLGWKPGAPLFRVPARASSLKGWSHSMS